MYFSRALSISQELEEKSVLLLGPRQTGKSSLIRNELSADVVYNLLRADTFQQISARPSLIRESLKGSDRVVVIDEIQKLPSLMDEVHYMIEEHRLRFLLTGSSARKLRRSYTSLMAGRVRTRNLYPLSSIEIPNFSLERALAVGTLPAIYLSTNPWEDLSDYVGTYLKEEIQAEAISRKIENFSRFLVTAAISNAKVINFESISRDAQVPPRTIREYYAILEDTLVGTMLPVFATKVKRKSISRGKFYFFDIGVVHSLTRLRETPMHAGDIGDAFEHFIFRELQTYLSYRKVDRPLAFWRSTCHKEVDFVIGDDIAIEVKYSTLVNEKHIVGLNCLAEATRLRRKILVSRDNQKRQIGDVEIYPYQEFLQELWNGQIA